MKKWIIFITSLLMLVIVSDQTFFVKADSPQLSIKSVLPDNQTNKSLGYFDLKITPGLKQNLLLKVKNNGDKPLKIDVNLTDAYTTLNGDIDYSRIDTKGKSSSNISLKNIILPDINHIELAADQETNIILHMTIPDNIPQGCILGGIMFKENIQSDTVKSKNQTVSNQFAYVKGIKLNYGKIPESSLKATNARLSKIQYKPTVLFTFTNVAQALVSGIQLKEKLEKVGVDKAISTDKLKVSMVPCGITTLPMKVSQKTLSPGEYKLMLDIKNKESDKYQTLYFKVNQIQSKKYQAVPTQVKHYIPKWIIAIAVILVLIVVVLIGTIFHQYRKIKRSN